MQKVEYSASAEASASDCLCHAQNMKMVNDTKKNLGRIHSSNRLPRLHDHLGHSTDKFHVILLRISFTVADRFFLRPLYLQDASVNTPHLLLPKQANIYTCMYV